jgi:hypothetical protein
MNPYVIITFRTFTIWIMAAAINGFFCGIYMSFFGRESETIPLIFFCGALSLFFSVPGFFIFWIVMLISISKYIYERALFRAALSVGLILAASTAVISSGLYSSVSSTSWFVFPLFIIVSTIASIMMHFNLFKKIKGNSIKMKTFN